MPKENEFFYNEEEQQENQNVPARTPKKGGVPPEYVKITLSSLGKLGVPAILHVRDYLGEDAIKLGMAPQERVLATLVDSVNNMIYEDIDAGELHVQELVEIMLNVYVNFWGQHIRDYPFPLTDEEWASMDEDRKERLIKGMEKLEVDIDIAALKTDLMDENFKEPIRITNTTNGKKMQVDFIFPRINHLFVVERYIEEKYVRESQEFQFVESILRYNDTAEIENQKSIDPKVLESYKKYIIDKQNDFAKIQKALLLDAIDGKKLVSIEDKVEAYKIIPASFWAQYAKVEDKYSKFGVDYEAEVESPLDGKKTVRRFEFRLMDFIPDDGLCRDEDFTVSFG